MQISYQNRRFVESLYDTNQYLQVKGVNDIPKEVIEQIQLVSLPGSKEGDEQGQPFGSYINRISDYFGDIDVIQVFTGCCNMKEVGVKTAKAIQEMVAQIKKKEDRFFSEFKAGIDHTYYFNIGSMVEGVYRPSERLLRDSEILYKHNLLSDPEIKVIREIAQQDGNGNDYDIIFNLFRERFILRWTETEVLQGFKMLHGKKKLLSEAVLDHTAVKIDMISINSGGKVLEVTNFMAIGLSNKKGYFIPINIDAKDISPEDLPIEIEKHYYSNFHYKPFKVVKRSFAFLKFLVLNWDKRSFDKSKYVLRGITKEYLEDLVGRYVQLLKTSVNILYTVKSELEAIKILLGITQRKGIVEKINERLDMLKEPVANVIEFNDDDLDLTIKMMDKCIGSSGEKKIEWVNLLIEMFSEVINFWTIVYFDQLGLNPPPAVVLPERMMYDPSIIRQPDDIPPNPLKLALEQSGLKGGFLKSLAKSIFHKAANVYRRNFCGNKARPLYKGEFHWGCHNYTGPGTNIWRTDVRNYPPYNNIDACSRTHDLDYEKAVELPEGDRQKAIIEADKKAVQCYSKFPNENGASVAKMGINSKLTFDQVLPIVSKSLFGKISAAPTGGCQECEGKCGGRSVKSWAEGAQYGLKMPGQQYQHLRPGEDPEVAKTALKDAFGVVTSIAKGNPLEVAKAFKQVGTHIYDLATADRSGVKRTVLKEYPRKNPRGSFTGREVPLEEYAPPIPKGSGSNGKVWVLG